MCFVCFFCVCPLLLKRKKKKKKGVGYLFTWLSVHQSFNIHTTAANSKLTHIHNVTTVFILCTLLWSWKYECVKLDICYHCAIHLCNINFETTQHERFYKGKKFVEKKRKAFNTKFVESIMFMIMSITLHFKIWSEKAVEKPLKIKIKKDYKDWSFFCRQNTFTVSQKSDQPQTNTSIIYMTGQYFIH